MKWSRCAGSFAGNTYPRSDVRSAGYLRGDRARAEPTAGTHAAGSTSRYGTFPQRPFASDPGVWRRSRVHPLSEFVCCPAVQILAPAEPAAVSLAARGEYLRLRPKTGFLCPPAQTVRACG